MVLHQQGPDLIDLRRALEGLFFHVFFELFVIFTCGEASRSIGAEKSSVEGGLEKFLIIFRQVPNSGAIEPRNFVFDHLKFKYEVR